MKKNMGNVDKVARILIALIFGALYFTGVISGALGIVLMVLSAVFVLTSVVSFCPLYTIFGFSSCPVKNS
jgi:hypothetical protein